MCTKTLPNAPSERLLGYPGLTVLLALIPPMSKMPFLGDVRHWNTVFNVSVAVGQRQAM